MSKRAKIINLIGGPNTGKTTTALGLTYFMKRAGMKVAYAPEYALDMVYEERSNILADQLYILAKQNRRQLRMADSNDYIVTDSPLFLSLVYSPNGGSEDLRAAVWARWNEYDNITFYHPRDMEFEFEKQGRVQKSHEECRAIDRQIEGYLVNPNVRSSAYELELGRNYVRQIIDFMRLPVANPFAIAG